MPSERVPFFLVARCESCKKPFTSYQLERRWLAAEQAGVSVNACPCGGNRFRPTNTSLWEELTTPALWEAIWKDVIKPKLGIS